jgi:hypothetical protein
MARPPRSLRVSPGLAETITLSFSMATTFIPTFLLSTACFVHPLSPESDV